MTTAKKPAARKTTARKTAAPRTTTPGNTTRKTAARKTAAPKATSRRTTRRTTTTRRKRPAVATTVGTALGTLVVASLLKLSWPARIGLVVLVAVLALGYLLWHNRAAIRAEAAGPAPSPDATTAAPPTSTSDPEAPA